jgi:hypothetical protein
MVTGCGVGAGIAALGGAAFRVVVVVFGAAVVDATTVVVVSAGPTLVVATAAGSSPTCADADRGAGSLPDKRNTAAPTVITMTANAAASTIGRDRLEILMRRPLVRIEATLPSDQPCLNPHPNV